MPVSEAFGKAWNDPSRRGDSTGCGDNFAGGVIASIAEQIALGNKVFDFKEACRLGIVSGGFAGLYYGGTWQEREPGEKRRLLQPYYEEYLQQTSIA
jgi:sugar/nucleoside kinase (ribokinase family)